MDPGEVARLEKIIADHFKNRTELLKIAAVVKEFITKRKLVLYGGQAIDYALRMRGSKIYEEHELPDFDFYSPQHAKDAYDLAEILIRKGYKNVSAINAMHPQTMRIRVEIYIVADISSMPPAIFKLTQSEAIKYQGMLVRNPYNQMTDLVRALATPLDGFPLSAYKARTEKDVARFSRLLQLYSVTPKSLGIRGKMQLEKFTLRVDHPQFQTLNGTAAYAVYFHEYKKLGMNLDGIQPVEFSQSGTQIEFTAAKGSHPVLDICQADKLNNGDEITQWYRPFMDTVPLSGMSKDGIMYHFDTNLFVLVTQFGDLKIASKELLLQYFFHWATLPGTEEYYKIYLVSLLLMFTRRGDLLEKGSQPWGCKNTPVQIGFYPGIKKFLPEPYYYSEETGGERPEEFTPEELFLHNGSKIPRKEVVIY